MKKAKKILKSSILVGALSLLLSANGWSKDGSLTEISRPYLGEYKCESLYFNGEDKLGDFEYFKLEIRSGGEMKLLFKEKDKKEKCVDLTYEYDETKKEFTVKSQFGVFKKEEKVPFENGKLTALLRLGGKQVVIKFGK
ncbi:MAG: hypothetical protein E7343_00695 [Clostridiales bacterium]|nr:hypothetical protein [Clostridiales bacterium]